MESKKRGKKFQEAERPFYTVLGVASPGQVVLEKKKENNKKLTSGEFSLMGKANSQEETSGVKWD